MSPSAWTSFTLSDLAGIHIQQRAGLRVSGGLPWKRLPWGNRGQTLWEPRAIHGFPLISPQTSETMCSRDASYTLGHLSHVEQLIINIRLHISAFRLSRSVSQIHVLKAFVSSCSCAPQPTYWKTVGHENNHVRTGLFKHKNDSVFFDRRQLTPATIKKACQRCDFMLKLQSFSLQADGKRNFWMETCLKGRSRLQTSGVIMLYLWPFWRFHNREFTTAFVLENKSSHYSHIQTKWMRSTVLFWKDNRCAFNIAR